MTKYPELAAYAVRFEPFGAHVLIRIGTARPLASRPGYRVDLDALPPGGELILTAPDETELPAEEMRF
jgi:hypothetical protein